MTDPQDPLLPIQKILVTRDEAALLMSESVRSFTTKVKTGIYPKARIGGGKMGVRGAKWSVRELIESQAG